MALLIELIQVCWTWCIPCRKSILGGEDVSRLMPAGEWLSWLAALCHAPWATNLHTPIYQLYSVLILLPVLLRVRYMPRNRGNKFTYSHISALLCFNFVASFCKYGEVFPRPTWATNLNAPKCQLNFASNKTTVVIEVVWEFFDVLFLDEVNSSDLHLAEVKQLHPTHHWAANLTRFCCVYCVGKYIGP